MLARPVHTVNLGAEAVADSTPYVLIDLSDTTNFPHGKTQELHLLGLILDGEKAADGAYDVWVGVVLENDATDGSVQWIHAFHLESVGNATDSTDRFHHDLDFTLGGVNPDGLNCAVVGGAMPFFVSNQSQVDNGGWQNDVNRVSPVGTTTKVGTGDVVVWVEEVSGSGTLDFSLTAFYAAA
jgi:hypothetical protein